MSMERLPNLSFVGEVSDKARKEKREEYERYITEDHRIDISPEKKDQLDRFEVTKTPEEIRLFEFADSWGQERQRSCGVDSYQFPTRNIFLFKPDGYKELIDDGGSTGSAHAEFQRVVAIARENKFHLTSVVFHEMTHCRGKLAVEITEQDGPVFKNNLRMGISVNSTRAQNRKGEFHEHLQGLEEAVVSQEEVHFSFDLLNRPEFQALKRAMTSEAGKIERAKILESEKLDDDDLLYFDSEKKEFAAIGYSRQRKVLRYICQEIAEVARSTENEVYYLFLKAHFTGHLLEIARLVEKAFGPGSFRRLGDMGVNASSAVQTLEALKKMRLNMSASSGK